MAIKDTKLMRCDLNLKLDQPKVGKVAFVERNKAWLNAWWQVDKMRDQRKFREERQFKRRWTHRIDQIQDFLPVP